ncbi:MAG: oligosaccharide flippase family protein [Acidaminococcaceae bacterium]|nr:oligosaccharide flippase family protein [Acidaminococcaceae bacterium]
MPNSNSKELKIGVILSYLQMAVNICISLVYTPVMLTMLGKSEYGVYSIAASTMTYLNLLEFGFAQAYVRFFSEEKINGDKNSLAKLNGLFSLTFLIMGTVTFFVGALITFHSREIFGMGLSNEEHQLVKTIMTILTVSTAYGVATNIYSSIIIAYEKFIVHRVVNLLRSVLNPIIVWILLLVGYRSIMLAFVTGGLAILVGTFYLIYCFGKLKIPLTYKNLAFGKLKEIGTFSFFIALNFIFDQVAWTMDRIILGRMVGAAAVAVYAVGVQFCHLFMTMSTSVSSVFTPRINIYVAAKESKEVLTNLFIKIGRVQMIILLPILLGFVFLGQPFIRLCAPSGYDEAYWVAVITMTPLLIALIQNTGIAIQMAMNQHRFRSIVYTALAVVHLIMSILICEKYGAVGGALGTAMYLIFGPGVLMNWYYQKYIGLDIISFWKDCCSFIPTVIVLAITGCWIMYYADIASWKDFILYSLLFAVVYVVMIWLTAMNRSEKDLFVKPIRKVLAND